eukprot:CAMPEP_0119312766 /NCGR_PEP_ID=MMETSP1333-20130426/27000_1 /TAXON_ID=418940 /ORGANISM="Scyphosphaera apsteinii, Strain RCC1455" /LENGTH=100 /DNA_ID=CAMNT_0007317429 /DNA_START=456 /DNA_END=755 /DNA_ORIENTATION=-
MTSGLAQRLRPPKSMRKCSPHSQSAQSHNALGRWPRGNLEAAGVRKKFLMAAGLLLATELMAQASAAAFLANRLSRVGLYNRFEEEHARGRRASIKIKTY